MFESAIDLLSYATIMKMRTSEWRADPMVGKDYNDYLMYIHQRNREKRMAAARYERPR